MRRVLGPVLILALLAAPAPSLAAPKFVRVSSAAVGSVPNYGMVRTPDGVLHLVFQTYPSGGAQPNGLATRPISPGGALGAQIQALSGWNTTRPGLVRLPNGTLQAVFGAINPDQTTPGSVWGIASSDGGATWSAPANVGTGGNDEALTYGSDMTAALAGGSTPVVTMAAAGNVLAQLGLGSGSTVEPATDASNNSAGDVDSAVDAGTGQVVASWQSNAGSSGDFVRAIAPSLGTTEQWPGQLRNEVVIAGRDKGPGIFAAYTAGGASVRLQRYGGGSVAVGKLRGIVPTKLGTATGVDGRIWVLWGDDNGVAVTRSNKAVTRFEPIQRTRPDSAGLLRLSGDGRLGPLDLLVDQIPNGNPIPPGGTFWARVLPELSATAKVKKHKLTVTVTDAGDAVSAAKVKAAGKSATTNAKGIATIKLAKKAKGNVAITVTKAGYNALKLTAKA